MGLKIYNTLMRQKEEFVPLEKGKVRMYNCGPTVYSHPHIGNFRSFIFADILRRYLEYKGYEVLQVMNITDVGHLTEDDLERGEDKIEAAARRERKDPRQIADFYADQFARLSRELNLRPALVYPRASEHLTDMIEVIKKLLEKGYAYVVKGCVYYDVSRFKSYGSLSGNILQELRAGARVEVHPDKKNPLDFALWKCDPQHLMQWDSPWGRGFPGWHIECSAMAMKYLGDTLDIHTGGEDNIFPHHECEIAQSEGATGKPFARYWMHARHLLVENEKMSKSRGNFYTVKDILGKGYSARVLRYLLLSVNYRQPLNFTREGLEASRQAVERLLEFKRSLGCASEGRESQEIPLLLEKARGQFETAMDDDLNISPALAAIFDLVREINKQELCQKDAAKVLKEIEKFDQVLGILEEERIELNDEERNLIREREEARQKKDWKKADALRKELKEKGIILKDHPGETTWQRG